MLRSQKKQENQSAFSSTDVEVELVPVAPSREELLLKLSQTPSADEPSQPSQTESLSTCSSKPTSQVDKKSRESDTNLQTTRFAMLKESFSVELAGDVGKEPLTCRAPK